MRKSYLVLSFALLLAMLLVACNSTSGAVNVMDDMGDMTSEPMSDEGTVAKDDEMMKDDSDSMEEMKDDSMTEAGDAMKTDEAGEMQEGKATMEPDAMMTPDWYKVSMTNVQTGENFTIADYSGKVVLVETLAMWCSKCFRQQENVKELHNLLGMRDDFVSVGIDIDPNERADALKNYVGKNDFDWVYSVAPTEVAREIGQLYGTQFLNPPSTPMLIIDRHGEAHPLPFGIKSAQDLLNYLEPFLKESM
jgi:hypothetical protein